MKRDDATALNQIAYCDQFVDPEVEHFVRSFHHHGFSCAGSQLEQRVGHVELSPEELGKVEFQESRFSHISSTLDGFPTSTQGEVIRRPSLSEGSVERIDFRVIATLLAKALGSDSSGRREYASGGALYSAETLIVVGDQVEGVPPYCVLHYLPTSNRFEFLASTFDKDRFETLVPFRGASFYLGYFINLKRAIFKYRSRGYRLALMEIGSMYHLAMACAQESGFGSRVYGGFQEYEFARLCGVDCRLLLPVVVQAFGSLGGDNAS